jgi:hypothetical protein
VDCSKKLERFGIDLESVMSPILADVWDEASWYKAEATRQDAVKEIKDKLDGTFLIRKSQTGELALSLTLSGGQVGHCIIFHGTVGYGFNKQTAYFPSVRALVLYYSAHTLADFNEQLKTHLKHPAFAPQPSSNQQS